MSDAAVQQTLTPPPANNGQRPAWLDDPSLHQIDYNAIAQLGQTVEAAMQQQMIQRGEPATSVTPTQQDQLMTVPGIPADAIPAIPAIPGVPDDQTPTGPSSPIPGQVASAPGDPSAPSSAGGAASDVEQTGTQSAAPATPPDNYLVNLGVDAQGVPQVVTLSQAQLAQALYTQQWFDQQPAQLKQQWAAIRDGQAQALTQQDIANLQRAAMEQARLQQTATQQSAPAQPTIPQRPDLTYADQATIDHIARLEQLAQQNISRVDQTPQRAQQQFTPGYAPQPNPQNPVGQFQSTIDIDGEIRKREQLNQVETAIRTRYNLSDAQLNHLRAVTVQRGLVPQIQSSLSVTDPFGAVLRAPDPGTVFTQAFETVMATDPTLRPVYEDALVSTRLAQTQGASTAVQGKKAAAGSLAQAAPAAVPSTPQNPATLTHQQTVDGIAAMLDEARANGTMLQ